MILKAKDLRDKTIAELKEELEDLRKQLFTSRMDFHARRLENSSAMREIKKSVARILTVIKEKEGEANA
jgi:large subunit ribosomal protein L29